MPEMICPFCKKAWPQDFRWCMEDGSELEQNIGQYDMADDGMPGLECPDCGARIDPRDEFCAGCGSRLQSAEEARAATEKLSCPKCGNAANPTEPFCGHCGAPLGEEPEVPQAAPAGAPAAASAAACPNCGMTVNPGDAACGTCGQMLAAAAPAYAPPAPAYAPSAPAAPAPAAAMVMCPQCQLELPPGTDYCHSCGYQFVKSEEDIRAAGAVAFSGMGSCPNCGMEMQPGEAFCGTCGFNLAAAAAAAAPEPAAAAVVEQPPAAAASCPNCGMEVQAGETFCGTCGFNLAADATPVPPAPQMETPAPADDSTAGCPNCGMEIFPGENMCSTCGHEIGAAPAAQEPPPAYQPPPAAAAPPPAASGDVSACPTCGMDVMPGETMCTTCGQDLTGESAQYEAAPEPPPAPAYAPPAQEFAQPELEVRESLLKLRCKECGSTRTTQGGMFCAVCGAMIGQDDEYEPYTEPDKPKGARSGDMADPFAPPPDLAGPEPDGGDPFVDDRPAAPEAPMPSLGDVTGSDLVCPQCGLEGYPGTDTCFACGTRFVPQSEVVAAAAASAAVEITDPLALSGEPEPELEPAEYTPAPPAGPSLLDITGETMICSVCGLEAIRGAEICTGCGGRLISAAQEIEQTAAQLQTPEPEPESEPQQAAQAPAGGEKICTCCGSANPDDVEFCAVCGVDF